MSEQDLTLKLATARWFWSLGSAALLRVPLSTFKATPARGKAAVLELTDLDVLGVEVDPDFGLHYRIAECKSGRVGALELFWLRGVVEFFGASGAYLVVAREQDRTSSMRDLGARLGLGILTANDFDRLADSYRMSSDDVGLFDEAMLKRFDALLAGTPSGVKELSDYVGRLFWQLPIHRNLEYGISYLEQAKKGDVRDRGILCLIGEHAFRYCLALFAACEAILKRGLPNLQESLPAYLFGGEHNLREAQQRVHALKTLQQRIEGGDRADLESVFQELPPYYDSLLELITRLLRRPDQATAMLRTLQTVVVAAFANRRPITEFVGEPEPLTSKLLLDVITFLVTAADLDRSVVTAFESALHGDTGDAAAERRDAAISTSDRGRADKSGDPPLSTADDQKLDKTSSDGGDELRLPLES
ncbi:MAG: hypothetical protein WKF41_06960 [Gaiellaceae bacterium]